MKVKCFECHRWVEHPEVFCSDCRPESRAGENALGPTRPSILEERAVKLERDLRAAYAAIRDADAGMVAVNGDTKRWRKKHAGVVEKARKETSDG